MNKTILVTGASRGIGRAIAHAFADCGYHVFLNCNSSVKQLREVQQQEIEAQYPGAATCVPGNIGNPDDVRNIFKSIYNKYNALDVLVNNAGVSHLGLLSDMTDDEWNRVIQTNFVLLFSTAAGKPSRKWYPENPDISLTFLPCGAYPVHPVKLLILLPNQVSTD